MIDLQAAVAQAREYADQHVDDSDKWLASFDAKMTDLGFANLKAPCRCADADMGHDPECGWGVPENSVNGKTADVKAGDITVTQNDEREGVEIRFASKPPAAILSHLKDAGWRWSKFSKCWYAKRSTKTLAFAYAMVGEKAPAAEDEGLRAMTNVDHFQEEAWASQVGK